MTAPMEILPGVYPDLSNEAYHSGPGLSKSGLDLLAKSPYLFRYRPKPEPSKALLIGSAFHASTLEPHTYANLFAVAPEINARTNAGKAELETFRQANAGKSILTAEDAEKVAAMAQAARCHPVAAQLLAAGVAETSIYHRDEPTGELLKVRPDWIVDDLIVDLKSTEDASAIGFSKSCANYRYHVQAAYYLDIANAVMDRRFTAFIFIAVEKSPPYQVAVYHADYEMIMAGRMEYRRLVDLYHECRVSDRWPGLNDGRIEAISLPRWATRNNDN